MKLLKKYCWNSSWYGIVEDSGKKVEIKIKAPENEPDEQQFFQVAEKLNLSTPEPVEIPVSSAELLKSISNVDLLNEVEKRNIDRLVSGVAIK